jgi:flagellin
MGFAINTNVSALNSYRNLSNTQNDISKSLEKLSTGLRINRAADDAAGLSISEGLRSQVNGLNVAARNAQDGISVIQTAEGALTEVHSILQRMRDLAVQAGNDSNNADAREAIKTEVDGLTAELDRISKSTNFNGTNLLDGSKPSLMFQVGADGNASSQIEVNLSGANVKGVANTLAGGDLTTTGTTFAIADVADLAGAATFTTTKDGVSTTVTTADLGAAGSFDSVEKYADALRADAAFAANFSVSVDRDANGGGSGIVVTALNGGTLATADNGTAGTGLGAGAEGAAVTGGLKFDTAANAQASIRMIDDQIEKIADSRSSLGAVQNRFEHSIKHINISAENLSASESRIRDADMAKEMSSFTKSQIMSQAGTAMLAQANQINQGVLQLLG